MTSKSNIDICVIMDTDNKRLRVQEILLEVTEDIDVDIIVYTPVEWKRYKDGKIDTLSTNTTLKNYTLHLVIRSQQKITIQYCFEL